MRPVLDEAFKAIIACPLCKIPVVWLANECFCDACGHRYLRSTLGVWSFMLQYPAFLHQGRYENWRRAQKEYQAWDKNLEDNYEEHLAEIEWVREIYSTEFSLSGTVLDVGGHQGRLRHFLPVGTSYLSIDPYGDVFEGLNEQRDLVRAFPCLREPCNFLQAHAERLPLKTSTIDYVHLRAVLDHFFDPYLALCEARRVLRKGGGVMIGVAVAGHQSPITEGSCAKVLLSRVRKKVRDEGMKTALLALAKRVSGRTQTDVHIWHPTYADLLELLRLTHFAVEKIYWQKPPFDHVVYLMARKK